MRISFAGLFLALTLGAALLPARPPEEFPGLNGKWRYYTSPHFEMYSLVGDRESRDAMERLELLRAVILDTFKLQERLPLPVTIFYFDSVKDFRGYMPAEYRQNESYVGFCYKQPDRTVIELAPSDDDDAARAVVYHEYIHHVFLMAQEDPPPWFNEGVAELYSTIRDGRQGVEIGLPAPGRVEELRRSRMLPLEQLFDATYNSEIFTNDGHTGIFYAESWALLHFCQFGSSRIPRDRLHLFLRAASSPVARDNPAKLRQACRELLGCDYPELMRQLQQYMVDGSYHYFRLPRPKIDAPATYAVRPAPRQEMADRLAELSLRVNRTPLAKLALLRAVDREPEAARLHEVLGSDATRDGDMTEVREHWERAVALGTTNPAIYHQLGLIEGQRWFGNFDYYFRLPAERAGELRRLLHRSIECAPNQRDAYEMLAWVEATAEQPDIADVNLVQAHFPSLLHKPRTLLALALVRLHLHDRSTATTLLDQISKMGPDALVDRAVQIVRARMEGVEPPPPVGRADMPERMAVPLLRLPEVPH